MNSQKIENKLKKYTVKKKLCAFNFRKTKGGDREKEKSKQVKRQGDKKSNYVKK